MGIKYEKKINKRKKVFIHNCGWNICVCKWLSNNFEIKEMKKIRNIRRSKLTISIIVAISRDIYKKMKIPVRAKYIKNSGTVFRYVSSDHKCFYEVCVETSKRVDVSKKLNIYGVASSLINTWIKFLSEQLVVIKYIYFCAPE